MLWWSSRRDKGLSSHIHGTLQGSPWPVALGSLISRHKDRTPTYSHRPTRNAKIIGFSINFWQIINTEEPFKRAMLNFFKRQRCTSFRKRPSLCGCYFSGEKPFCDGGWMLVRQKMILRPAVRTLLPSSEKPSEFGLLQFIDMVAEFQGRSQFQT